MEQKVVTNISDKGLLEAHLRGEREAFGELVRRHGGGLLGYLVKMSGSRDIGEDLFQETFKRVHEKAHTLRGANFKGWLYSVATHAAIDDMRKRRKFSAVSLDAGAGRGEEAAMAACAAGAAAGCDPCDEAARGERAEAVRRAIGGLPVKQRAALVLAYYQQLNYAEVGRALGCSVGSVKRHMSRALQTLARRLPEMGMEVGK